MSNTEIYLLIYLLIYLGYFVLIHLFVFFHVPHDVGQGEVVEKISQELSRDSVDKHIPRHHEDTEASVVVILR
jgi:hypothetical protein